MFDRVKGLFSSARREARLQEQLERLRQRMPAPVFWLFGKTQSGKTSIVKYLTGADAAEIGKGFQPCTRFSKKYPFPIREAPLLTFLDTRGLDEPGYDPREDLEQFNDTAHVLLVTVKVLDHAQEKMLEHLRTIRNAKPSRPVLLVLTCLHEAYPQQQHPLPYPFTTEGEITAHSPALPQDLTRSLAEQRRRFGNLVDRIVAVDLTPSDEGFNDPDYGGPLLRQILIGTLSHAATLGTDTCWRSCSGGSLSDSHQSEVGSHTPNRPYGVCLLRRPLRNARQFQYQRFKSKRPCVIFR